MPGCTQQIRMPKRDPGNEGLLVHGYQPMGPLWFIPSTPFTPLSC